MLYCDNKGKFSSQATDLWAYQNRVPMVFSRPGKPTENAFVESFNGSLREECLTVNWFLSLEDARGKIEAWPRHYNERRPHTALGGVPPSEFVSKTGNFHSLAGPKLGRPSNATKYGTCREFFRKAAEVIHGIGHRPLQSVYGPIWMSSQLKLPIFILVFFAIQTISPGCDSTLSQIGFICSRQDSQQSTPRLSAPSPDQAEVPPQCETAGMKKITISCSFTPSLRGASDPKDVARIVLNHAELSFEPNHESPMLVELEFTNVGGSSITSAPTVYLAIDDDTGRNVIRRALPNVDLARLRTGERLTFSDRFLVGAFPGGRYTISLSIPDPELSRKNNPAYNMLLSSTGVPNPTTGQNTVAHFSVTRSIHSSRDK
jgi:hypothetical protein